MDEKSIERADDLIAPSLKADGAAWP